MQLLIVYSVNVLLVVAAFSELAQFFQCFLQMIVGSFEYLTFVVSFIYQHQLITKILTNLLPLVIQSF